MSKQDRSNASVLHVGRVGRNSFKVKHRRHHGPVIIVQKDDDGNEIGRAKEDICEFVTIEVRVTDGDSVWYEKINGLRINSKLYDTEGKIHHLNAGEYKTIDKFVWVPDWANVYLQDKFYSHKFRVLNNPEYVERSSRDPKAGLAKETDTKVKTFFEDVASTKKEPQMEITQMTNEKPSAEQSKETDGENSIFDDKELPEDSISVNKKSLIKGYELTSIAETNIMFHCLKKNLDVYEILEQCDNQMDQLMSDAWQLQWAPFTDVGIVYLSFLADAVGMSFSSLFRNTEKQRKEWVSKFLKSDELAAALKCGKLNFSEDEGNYEITWDSFDYDRLKMKRDGKNGYLGFPLRVGRQKMMLEFSKEKDGDAYWYSLSYGDLYWSSGEGIRQYSVRGAYIWEEESGELQEFIDRTISETKRIDFW